MRYLKEHRKATHTTLLTSGKLNTYLAAIDEQAEEMYQRLIEEMEQIQGVTEQLKAERPMDWIGKMGYIQACAREVVNNELIFA